MIDGPIQAEDRLRAAMLASDTPALESLLDDRLAFLGPGGARFGKRDDIEAHRTGFQKLSRLDVLALSIEEHGDTAIAVVDVDLEGLFGEARISGKHRYLRTWLHSSEGWKVVAGCVSPLEAAPR